MYMYFDVKVILGVGGHFQDLTYTIPVHVLYNAWNRSVPEDLTDIKLAGIIYHNIWTSNLLNLVCEPEVKVIHTSRSRSLSLVTLTLGHP